jgi:hypothetical protein
MTADTPDQENRPASDRYAQIPPAQYYDDLGEAEWERLDAGPKARYEFENTTDYLASHLPEEGHVLDADERARAVDELHRVAADVEAPEFVECHFFRAPELRRLLSGRGFSVATVAGLEGVASNFGDAIRNATAESQATIGEVVRDPEFREDPTVADLSNHILAVAHATPEEGG